MTERAEADVKTGAGFIPRPTYESEGPKCPYCGHQYTADEPHYFDEQNYIEETCCTCGKTFDVDVCRSVDWSCEPRGEA